MNDAIKACDTALETNDVTQVHDTALRLQPDFRSSEYTSNTLTNGYSNKLVSCENQWKIVFIIYIYILISFQNEAEMNNKNINNSTNFATDFNDAFKNGMYEFLLL